MALTLASNAITFTDNTSLSSGVIGTAQLSASSVTTEKLSAGAVTFDKISQNSGPFSFRNKIINGDMRISQRNGNNAVSVPNGNTYPVDRFSVFGTIASTFTTQRLSADGPGPIASSIRCTLNTTRTPAAGDVFGVTQYIEAQNIYELEYGTVNARPITLSFWAKASTTGTYGARLIYGPTNVSYVYTYTINQVNTWEYKTVTIPGNTTQALNPDPIGIGLDILWNLGAGTTRRTSTTNQWISGDFHSATGTVSFVELSPGATWQITGVQLEVGTVATPFEQRPIGLELSLCQRYYQIGNFKHWSYNTSPNPIGTTVSFATSMRAAPNPVVATNTAAVNVGALVVEATFTSGFIVYAPTSVTGAAVIGGSYTASSEI